MLSPRILQPANHLCTRLFCSTIILHKNNSDDGHKCSYDNEIEYDILAKYKNEHFLGKVKSEAKLAKKFIHSFDKDYEYNFAHRIKNSTSKTQTLQNNLEKEYQIIEKVFRTEDSSFFEIKDDDKFLKNSIYRRKQAVPPTKQHFNHSVHFAASLQKLKKKGIIKKGVLPLYQSLRNQNILDFERKQEQQ
eukprot:Pgem_evm1s6150